MGEGDADGGTSWWTRFKVLGILLLVVFALGALPIVAGFSVDVLEPRRMNVVGLAGIVLGLLPIYPGFKAYRERQLVRDTPTSKVRSLAIGTSEVQGQAQPLAEPLVSPLTHTPACMYEFTVREKQTVRKTKRDRQTGRVRTETEEEWRTVLQLEEHVPFCIDDGTGRVPVEPDGAEMLIEVEKEAKADEGQAPPRKLAAWFEEHGDAEPFDPVGILPEPLAQKAKSVQEGDMDPAEMDPEDFYPEGFDPEDPSASNIDPQDLFLGSMLFDAESSSSEIEPARDTGEIGDARGSGSQSWLGMVKTVVSTGKEMMEGMRGASGKRKYLTQATGNERRFQERVLAVDEQTYVFGAAQRLPEADSIENVENLVLREDPTTGQFLVSDKSPQRLLDEKLVRACLFLGASLVLLSYGGMGVLGGAGLI